MLPRLQFCAVFPFLQRMKRSLELPYGKMRPCVKKRPDSWHVHPHREAFWPRARRQRWEYEAEILDPTRTLISAPGCLGQCGNSLNPWGFHSYNLNEFEHQKAHFRNRTGSASRPNGKKASYKTGEVILMGRGGSEPRRTLWK